MILQARLHAIRQNKMSDDTGEKTLAIDTISALYACLKGCKDFVEVTSIIIA
jgi:hypothetical protein